MTDIYNHEIHKFTSVASKWWDINGPFKPLHEISPIRMEYICTQIRNHIGKSDISGTKILDIGCGGGLVSVPLARLGANVTGIDLGEENIKAAESYAQSQCLQIRYEHIDIANIKEKYDVVLCLEVIEHIDNLDEFISHVVNTIKPGGIVIFSTINRTAKSLLLGIIAAEYLLSWVPKGTHSFDKFVKPSELVRILDKTKINVLDITGMSYNIFNKGWKLSRDIGVNYFLTGLKGTKQDR